MIVNKCDGVCYILYENLRKNVNVMNQHSRFPLLVLDIR